MKHITKNSLLLGLSLVPLCAQAQEKTNFVIIIGDDCSRSDLSCYGSPNGKTPYLDVLAGAGLKFNNCFQATAMSSPTRHCLYTGLYPLRSGAYPNHTYVYDDVKSFVQYFRPAGYRTALYGKEHVAPKKVFDYEYLGEYKKGIMDYAKMEDFIRSAKDSPFFLVVGSHESHSPWNLGTPELWDAEKIELPPLLVDTPETRQAYVKYLAEVKVLDEQVRNVAKVLENTGKADNTVFIFLSEQGNSFPFAKWTCYSEGLHSGMLMRWPGKIARGSTTEAIVEYADILPTLVDIAGIPHNPEDFDGKSFYPLLKNQTQEHKEYTYSMQTSRGIFDGPDYYGIRSVANKQYRYIYNLTPEATFQNTATRTNWWKSWESKAQTDDFARKQVEHYQHRPQEELYDVKNDPYEMNNLAQDKKYARTKKQLKNELFKWMESQGDKGQQTEMDALSRMNQGKGVKE